MPAPGLGCPCQSTLRPPTENQNPLASHRGLRSVSEGFGWLRALWSLVDERLAEISRKLRGFVRLLRVALTFLVIAILAVLAAPVVLMFWPEWFPIAYAVSTVILVIPLIALTALVALPLRLKSIIRLIDKGYPANAKEVAIRVAARKLHDQSIATEELLVDTALNEGRKMVQRFKARAEPDEGDPASQPIP